MLFPFYWDMHSSVEERALVVQNAGKEKKTVVLYCPKCNHFIIIIINCINATFLQ